MDRKDAIHKHVSNMLAVERHILEAIERQREEDDVRENVQANELIIKIERVTKQHVTALEELADSYDTTGESALKKAVTGVLGVFAGLYDKVRDYEVSRMLRDDYTALSLAAMGYTAFHTVGLALNEQRIADTAIRHLRDLTPLLVEISKTLPLVVAEEAGREIDGTVDTTVGARAVRNTQEAWEPTVTNV